MKYVYPAIFTEEKNGFSVNFPDIANCYTSGKDLTQALEMAQDVLCLMLYDMEEDGEVIPKASTVRGVEVEDAQFVSLITCDTEEYKKFFENKAVKKTLTIPFKLNYEAERQNINFSQVLQEALRKQLNI